MNRNEPQRYVSETPRLYLKILCEADAEMVLSFQTRNASVFEKFEPTRPEHFYTLSYQRAILNMETNLFQQKTCIRFWVFEKEDSSKIIGTISFNFLLPDPFCSCQIGYKFDPDYWHLGYAAESLSKAIQIAAEILNLHRIEAFVKPENTPSCHLLEKLDFEREGLAKRAILLNNVWTDHYRYALTLES